MTTIDVRPAILAIDHNRRNLQLLSDLLHREGYRTLTATTLDEVDERLHGSEAFALVLIDLSGFGRRIWSRCEQLRATGTPFLVISPRHSASLQQESLSRGARGVLVKPLGMQELLGLIRSMIG